MRQQAWSQSELWQRLHHDYGLADQMRFERLLATLAAEQLLTIRADQVQLG